MASPKPQQPARGDIERRIEHDDHVARTLYHNSQIADSNSELDGALAEAFEELGAEEEAESARVSQTHDLLESQHNKKQALAWLLDERMLMRMSAPPEDPKWLVARLPDVRAAVTAIFTAARDATNNAGNDGWAVTRAYREFIERAEQPVATREAVVAVLRALQAFLELVKPIAGADDTVRDVWIREAGVIASNL
jgi:hypothetical protein